MSNWFSIRKLFRDVVAQWNKTEFIKEKYLSILSDKPTSQCFISTNLDIHKVRLFLVNKRQDIGVSPLLFEKFGDDSLPNPNRWDWSPFLLLFCSHCPQVLISSKNPGIFRIFCAASNGWGIGSIDYLESKHSAFLSQSLVWKKWGQTQGGTENGHCNSLFSPVPLPPQAEQMMEWFRMQRKFEGGFIWSSNWHNTFLPANKICQISPPKARRSPPPFGDLKIFNRTNFWILSLANEADGFFFDRGRGKGMKAGVSSLIPVLYVCRAPCLLFRSRMHPWDLQDRYSCNVCFVFFFLLLPTQFKTHNASKIRQHNINRIILFVSLDFFVHLRSKKGEKELCKNDRSPEIPNYTILRHSPTDSERLCETPKGMKSRRKLKTIRNLTFLFPHFNLCIMKHSRRDNSIPQRIPCFLQWHFFPVPLAWPIRFNFCCLF